MQNNIFRIHGILDFLGIISFFLGIYLNNWTLIIIGGIILISLDIVSIFLGALKPLFPIIFAFILGITMNPWWYGVFSSVAIFSIFNISTDLKKIIKGAN
ncbi:MAG: hypothetical protein AAB913_00850 [Patescibacteria group bacterium]